jgi:hypothetical protein
MYSLAPVIDNKRLGIIHNAYTAWPVSTTLSGKAEKKRNKVPRWLIYVPFILLELLSSDSGKRARKTFHIDMNS